MTCKNQERVNHCFIKRQSTTELELENNQLLELSDRKFTITMFNMLNDLMEKINNRQKQIRNFIKEMKII